MTKMVSSNQATFDSMMPTLLELCELYHKMHKWVIQTWGNEDISRGLIAETRSKVGLPAVDVNNQAEERSHRTIHKTPWGAALSSGENEQIVDRIRIMQQMMEDQDKNYCM